MCIYSVKIYLSENGIISNFEHTSLKNAIEKMPDDT